MINIVVFFYIIFSYNQIWKMTFWNIWRNAWKIVRFVKKMMKIKNWEKTVIEFFYSIGNNFILITTFVITLNSFSKKCPGTESDILVRHSMKWLRLTYQLEMMFDIISPQKNTDILLNAIFFLHSIINGYNYTLQWW